MNFHLLPSTHPASDAINVLFSPQGVIDNDSNFNAAGFEIHVKKSRSLMRVATHPALPQYVFKVHFVDERLCKREKPCGWKGFPIRCERAGRIDRIIRERGFQYFHVPRKWLFVIPASHPACGLDDQPVVLIAERQDLVSRSDNEQAWLNAIAERHLDELYWIIQGAGGASYRPDNIRLTKQGKFTFIDTEHSCHEADFESVSPYLAPSKRQYWLGLIPSRVSRSG